ncbi:MULTISPECIES: cell division protein FtsQ/DivIB [Streptomyces]|uniref:cell division protein FtsQ/DivIB n=1 Tax=Streptomyces TaxID=1883 RepID=UPI00163B969D|nr:MULTISPECIES: FtsQ-type POTRA domain-containing protein [Streptomyces]MBC2877070.1 FtsQ-type POTRA domain-containing protein [Streptomyces sp. TYQ1024]UBI39344.1 FtsQ-type POTRA domain-containing protein [Streptomyces mobaraensis]UKW31924.1 FtsQ-type POTRA domain-containing protein [Streptomyces sp. TYQ1024]
MAGPTTARRGDERNRKPKRKSPAGSSQAPKKGGKKGGKEGGKPKSAATAGARTGLRRLLPRRSRLVFWTVAAVLLGAGAGWVLYGSGWLRATRVDVDGVEVLSAAEVREAAAVPLGDPLISVDTDAIAARLRARLPRIESVDVSRDWPHGVAVEVTERQPRAIVEKDGKFVEIDGSGVRFATVDRPPAKVPRLVMEAPADAPSTRRFGRPRLEREGVRAAAALPSDVRRDTRVIRVRSYDSIIMELTGGRTVVWGSGERGDAKARSLTALMKAARGADHFDVSAPGAPAASGS